MGRNAYPPADIAAARRAYFDEGRIPGAGVPRPIVESWQRCRELGLEAARKPVIEPVPEMALRQLRERNERLWLRARPELEALAGDARVTGSMVVLTDAEGWILDAQGSPDFLDRAGRVALRPGASWSEDGAGTNAVGMAMVEQRAIAVRGQEHYFTPCRILSCHAAPIFDPSGKMLGVLDLSGDSNEHHMHALGLVQMAVTQIERRLFDDRPDDCDLLRLHPEHTLLGSALEGLLGFRNGRLVAANRQGLEMLGLDRGDIGRARYDQVFGEPLSRLRQDGALVDRHGHRLFGSVEESHGARRPLGLQRGHETRSVVAAQPVRGGKTISFDAVQETALERARRVLDAGLPVLVNGETGTGKEVFARELHRRCARADMPFVAVNCAALPEGLIEAELFGYEEGAFTGARKQGSTGLMRQADGGVLFLDEIGDMPPALQPRLLRVLQERELTPLGGGKAVKLDFTLVCATHCDLEAAIATQKFRADLYYRISTHLVRLPPLREHADRRRLIETLWNAQAQGRTLTPEAFEQLVAYDWPGNLRQLAACLQTLIALSEPSDTLGAELLPPYIAARPAPLAAGEAAVATGLISNGGKLDALNRAAMREALAASNGNVALAARKLGVSRSTLYRNLGGELRG